MASPRPARPPLSRAQFILPAALVVAGTLAFLGAGIRHPHISSALGPIGSDEFFRAFAGEVMHTAHWETIHTFILFGPVLWAIGVAGATSLLPRRATALGEIARTALLLASAAWGVAFVLDGFVAPVMAKVILGADPAAAAAAIASFRANQLTVARLGMISLVLMGGSIATLAAALLSTARALSWRAFVGALGLVVGLWPLIDAARGEFYPGPFTSAHWTSTAISIGLWMAMFAVSAPFGAVAADSSVPLRDVVAAM